MFYPTLLAICLAGNSFCQAQILPIYSVTNERMPGGDGDVGYTLDGLRMIGSRAKLLNAANFGPFGTYNKAIEISDIYEVENISEFPDCDLFYFGTFNKNNISLIPFEETEIDSLYNWSLRGGKMIIGAAAVSEMYNYQPDILNSKWGFDIIFVPLSAYYPTPEGAASLIFSGPFGTIPNAAQGGAVQGNFSSLPEDIVLLATDNESNPNLYLDCLTLDLVLADGDGHNDLGGVTVGAAITSDNDKFWANTIAYMDALQDPPAITANGDLLSTGDYNSYQWFKNGVPVSGANTNTFTSDGPGIYSVEVALDCGCVKTASLDLSTGTTGALAGPACSISPNPANELLNIHADIPLNDASVQLMAATGEIMLATGLLSGYDFQLDISALPGGIYYVQISDHREGNSYSRVIVY